MGGLNLKLGDIKKMPFVEKESKNIEGMTVDAYLRLHNQMHSDELGVTKKEIIVPSFGTTTKIFT